MGALPKRRISKTRQAHKRSRYLKVKQAKMVPCPQCGSLRLAHTVCPGCGTYKGREILAAEDDAG